MIGGSRWYRRVCRTSRPVQFLLVFTVLVLISVQFYTVNRRDDGPIVVISRHSSRKVTGHDVDADKDSGAADRRGVTSSGSGFNASLSRTLAARTAASPAERRLTRSATGGGATDVNLLKDLFISVKTTGKYHKDRVDLLIRTWYSLARDQVFIISTK